jgi:ABC-type multidrug transport system fused ATPase/permease subunit
MFLANLSIIGTIGGSTGSIYKVLMDIQSISPALFVITDFLNLPTDLPQRKMMNRVNRGKTKEKRAALKGIEKAWPIDNLPVAIENVTYDYRVNLTDDQHAFNHTGIVEFHQGELIALVGPGGEGKSTLLKMIGQVVLSEPGQVYVPSSLRLLHVSTESLFFKGNLYDNMKLGINRGSPDEAGLAERIYQMCVDLGLPKHLLDFVKEAEKGQIHTWGEVLANSEKCLCGIARAIVANPELLCIHKPLMAQPDETAQKVMAMLRGFVDNKGILLDPNSRHLRRPRTCILTAAKAASAAAADSVYRVTLKGVEKLDRADVASQFL